MRIDKKIGKKADNDNVLVHFSDECNNLYVREGGKDNRYKYDKLLAIDDNKIIISNNAIKKYGIEVQIKEG